MAEDTIVADPITPTADAPKTAASVFDAARASVAAQSKDQGTADKGTPDDNAAPPPAEDPDKVADQPQEPTDDDDALLTPDEVSKRSAKERTLYEKAQKNYTVKSQKMAADRKALEEWNPLIEGFKADPTATLEKVAKQLGFTVAKAGSQDTKTAESADLPEYLSEIRPFIEARDKALEARIRAELEPVKKAHAEMAQEAVIADTESTIERFTAKYPEWKQHESKMLEFGAMLVPAPGSKMTDFEFMEKMHTLATSGIAEAEATKKVIAKMNKSAASSEDRTSGIPKERVAHTMPPKDKRSFKDAWEAAKRGEVWE